MLYLTNASSEAVREEMRDVPWDALDALFIGGSTAWKLGPEAATLAAATLAHGKHLHLGRVNSWRRWRYAEHLGCHTTDGTKITIAPDANLRPVRRWISQPAIDFLGSDSDAASAR